jgi:hypothetical protein
MEGLFSAQVDYIYHVETPNEKSKGCLQILSETPMLPEQIFKTGF